MDEREKQKLLNCVINQNDGAQKEGSEAYKNHNKKLQELRHGATKQHLHNCSVIILEPQICLLVTI
jgi:hypothetical protein